MLNQIKPEISIIIPTYNHLDLLKKCVDSIISYTDLTQCEIIIVANGCADGTAEYLKTLGQPFKYQIHDQPLGFTTATNLGIKSAIGKYVVLLNNDTVLLWQTRNKWIEILLAPFLKDKRVGITGPAKFHWDCGTTTRTAIGFWCAMIPKALFDEFGLLDEIFSPGMGEDGDFSIKVEEAGYKLVQVPIDTSEKFGSGISNQAFPIFHLGSGTFNDKDYHDISTRNTDILINKYGTKSRIQEIYEICVEHKNDTSELFPILLSYAKKCQHITEFGVRGVFTTWAFLAAKPKQMVSYDIEYEPYISNINEAKDEATKVGISFEFHKESTLEAVIEGTDLLFIDTKHTYQQLKSELERHANKVNKYILIHDTTTFGEIGEDGSQGEKLAINEFLRDNKDWTIKEEITYSNGMVVLEKKAQYCLPSGYVSQDPAVYIDSDFGISNVFQEEVYAKAKEIFNNNKLKSVIDVGCGVASKLIKNFTNDNFIGIEVGASYDWLKKTYPTYRWERGGFVANADLVICSDVIEHLHDPDAMFDYIDKMNPKFVVFSTPDRNLGDVPNGPPHNKFHAREWNFDEFNEYVAKHFDVLEHFYSNKAQGTQCIVCKPKIKCSVVIPSCGKNWESVLKLCLDAVLKYTDITDKEIIVVTNGASNEAVDYVKQLPVRSINFAEPIGYIRAVNAGIEIARGDCVVLLDDDSFLMEQSVDNWIKILHKPFVDNSRVGASSPFEQTYADLGRVLHSGCTMYRTSILKSVNMFDEAFNPGYMSDEDVSLRIRKAGYDLVEVPHDQKKSYNNGIFGIQFPVVHMGDVQTMNKHTDLPLVEKNRKLLYERHGTTKSADLKGDDVIGRWDYSASEQSSYGNRITYQKAIDFLDGPYVIEDWGCGTAFASRFVNKGRYVGIDGSKSLYSNVLADLRTYKSEADAILIRGVLEHNFEWRKILENALASFKNKLCLVLFTPFGTETRSIGTSFGTIPDISFKKEDILEYLKPFNFTEEALEKTEFHPAEHFFYVTRKSETAIFEKWLEKDSEKPKFSIIIPTFQHKDDLLIPAIHSLAQCTDLSKGEVIIVANGCTDGTEEYVKSLGKPFKVISFKDPMGYTKSTNEGIKVANGEYLILFNNDNELLVQDKNRWLKQLIDPFLNNPKMGITGPLQLHDDYADADVIIGFCLCIKKSVMQDAMSETDGLLDEIFSPGGGEDIDLCCKVRNKGYIVRQVPSEAKLGFSHTNTGDFLIWHKNNQTFKDIEEYTRYYVKRNGFYNLKRYNKNIKLNLGSGRIEYPGYLSVDLYDNHANIIMDVTKLDLEDNSVSELLALHIFEHLNPYKALDVLKEWYRVLKPGGKLIMEMPDIEQLCKRFVNANIGERYGLLNAIYGSVNTTDVGDQSDITSGHQFGWWPQSIWDHLSNAKFVDIKFGPEQFPHPESNFHVEATK